MGKRSRHYNALEEAIRDASQKKSKKETNSQKVQPVSEEPPNRGYVLPGYNYLGPGNSLNNGNPTNRDDWVAREHDHGYRDIENAGENPYITYSEADKVAQSEFGDSYGGKLGKAFFGQKEEFAKLGVIKKSKTKAKQHFPKYDDRTIKQVPDKNTSKKETTNAPPSTEKKNLRDNLTTEQLLHNWSNEKDPELKAALQKELNARLLEDQKNPPVTSDKQQLGIILQFTLKTKHGF